MQMTYTNDLDEIVIKLEVHVALHKLYIIHTTKIL